MFSSPSPSPTYPLKSDGTITSSDLEKGALNRPGKVRVDKIYTLSQSIVLKTFGRVNSATLEHIRQTLQNLTAKKP